MRNFTLLLFVISLAFTTCSDEFSLMEKELSLTKDWQETVAVFANINLSGNIHYVRVNRGFGGENFYLSNTDEDSIYFNASDLSVKLYKIRVNDFDGDEISDADTLGTYICRDTIIEKEEDGNFSTENVKLFYVETNEFSVSDATDLYVGLEVLTPSKKVTSYTKIVDGGGFIKPNPQAPNFAIENATFDIQIRLPLYSQSYRVEGLCSYNEVRQINNNKDTVLRTFSFLVGTHNVANPIIDYGNSFEWRQSTELFYGGLESDIIRNGDTVNTIARFLDGVRFRIYSGNADLALVTIGGSISSGFNTESIAFSNVNNGLGYLSAYEQFTTKKYPYSDDTQDSVVNAYGYKYYFKKN